MPETGLAHRICGMTYCLTGDFIDARQHLERAISLHESEQDRPLAPSYTMDMAVPPLVYLDYVLWVLGKSGGTRCLLEKAISHAERTKHRQTIASVYVMALAFAMARRDRERSGLCAGVLLDLAREHGWTAYLPYGGFCEGWLRCHAGDDEAGLAQMHSILQTWREQSYSIVRPIAGALLAEAQAIAGHHEAALMTIDSELAQMTLTGVCYFLSDAHRVRGELLLKSKPADIEAAEVAFTHAIEVAHGQSARRFELRAAKALAQLWMDRGERVEHRGFLAILADGLPDCSGTDGFA
jgi:predicted ATPase